MRKTLAIITIFILLVIGIAVYQQIITKPNSVQIYTNEKFGYSVNYPSGWTFREFPDTKDGAGFRPIGSPDEISSECVTIAARGAAGNDYDAPFDDYVKYAAVVEIQGYERLNSIEPIKIESGLIGYKTTWIYKFLGGEEKTSLPITYFENKKEFEGLKYKTIQISLNDESCKDIYNQMITTFRLGF